mgnify:CR=1 FL=1
MTVSFQAFRDRYPDAHITSDLLLVQRDRFVVKVTVTTTANGSASGLAAHTSIELAEDHARIRAFAAFGYALDGSRISNGPNNAAHDDVELLMPPAPQELAHKPKEGVEAATTLALPLEPVEASTDAQPSGPTTTSTESAVRHQPTRVSPPPSKPVKPVAPTQKEPPTLPTEEPAAESAVTTAITPAPTSDVANVPIPAEALPAPINLSDVIAQTDLELRRLGWSVETGRDYLEQTYQKRSRHELSEEELIQFLCHLESL